MSELVEEPVQLTEVGSAEGVVLRCAGEGAPIVVFPGLEGSGESCLHLVEPVVRNANGQARGRLVLVDYAAEKHRFRGELVETITELLRAHLGHEPVTWWGQSFGNLLLADVERKAERPTRTRVLVSPFTALPRPLMFGAWAAIGLAPRAVYRLTTPPVARWIFGPAPGHSGDRFAGALADMDPADVARRCGWLLDGDQAGSFLATDTPSAVWLGAQDRLVDLPRQHAFFTALARDGGQVTVVPGCGHVVLPRDAVTMVAQEIAEWIIDHP